MKSWSKALAGLLKLTGVLAMLAVALPAFGQEAAPAAAAATVAATAAAAPAAIDPAALSDMRIGLDTVWVLVAAFLVFFMNAGFALVESGLCRAKNCVNILSKNFVVFALSTVSFYMIG